ncbi:Conserved_hypothetical protein [Hexamita inflata]|uniref:Uncharacterized protein n=1 Tax=Hexamita inflata TaxID=28002 RepID=A0ABP1GFS4_9EUKA
MYHIITIIYHINYIIKLSQYVRIYKIDQIFDTYDIYQVEIEIFKTKFQLLNIYIYLSFLVIQLQDSLSYYYSKYQIYSSTSFICYWQLQYFQNQLEHQKLNNLTVIQVQLILTYADIQQIVVTIQTTNNSACDIPHGIRVSLQIDSLGIYEPYVNVRDYDYSSTTQIHLKCNNAACLSIPSSASGIIIIESKTKVTKIPAGSIRVSRGVAENCFNDSETYVELYQGSLIFGTVPTLNCADQISSLVNGVQTLNTLNTVKLYITYSDNSMTVHQDLTVEVLDDVFAPTNKVIGSSTYLRIRILSDTLSTYFNQSIHNGVISKDMKFFRFNLQFETDTGQPTKLIKIAQVTANYFQLPGFPTCYTSLSMQILDNGFFLQKVGGPNMATYNTQIENLGVTSYVIQYVFVYYNNAKTDEFRKKLVARTSLPDSVLFSNGAVQRTCEARFPNQNCTQILSELKQKNVGEIYAFISYFYYAGSTLVGNYSIVISNILDSCFSTGELSYNSKTQTLSISINMNSNSDTCQLAKNDQITIEISVANTSANVLISTQTLDYVPGVQKFTVEDEQIIGTPIRVQYFREGTLLDAVSLTEYVVHANNDLFMQEFYIVVKVLAAHFGCVVLYLIWHFSIYPIIIKYKMTQTQKAIILISEEDYNGKN